MNPARVRGLADALELATDALLITQNRANMNYGDVLNASAMPERKAGLPATFLLHFESRFNIEPDVVADPLGRMAMYLWYLDEFRQVCAEILAGLKRRPLEFVDISPRYQVNISSRYQEVPINGYVTRDAQGDTYGRIHLDFGDIWENKIDEVARTIVHEASHKFAHTKDLAYVYQEVNMRELPPGRALTNADSIAQMVMDTVKLNLR